MKQTQQPMRMFLFKEQVRWWPKNQVTLTFHSALAPTADNKQAIIDSLHLDDINRFLGEQLQLTLQSFEDKDIPHPRGPEEPGESLVDEGLEVLGKGLKAVGEAVERLDEGLEELGEKLISHVEKGEGENIGTEDGGQDDDDESDLNSPRGKYLFPSPDGQGSTMITFFNVKRAAGANVPAGLAAAEGKGDDAADRTVDVVNLFNTTPFIKAASGEEIKSPPAMPNWYGGSTDYIHGCPATPPIPVSADSSCIVDGYCPITLGGLSIPEKLGDGVTVFVLDSIPTPDQITAASLLANPSNGPARNRLLQDMANGMKASDPFDAQFPAINVHYLQQADLLEKGEVPRTGRDLYKELYGFKAPDHGLFVTGIIRDLAPHAKIECVRILNDYGVGTVSGLMQALETIQGRMQAGGDLQGNLVVINLSLVMTPDDELFKGLGFKLPAQEGSSVASLQDENTRLGMLLREGMHEVIRSLVNSGAVIVASAGNDSNSPEMPDRMGPRYPANFSEVVSVAAVNKNGDAAIFSNQATSPEQPNGIATYGGDLAHPIDANSEANPGCMTGAQDIDALTGVFTSAAYPKLGAGDCEDTYPELNESAWAYWSGTSFATPIISALAARIVQGTSNNWTSQQIIATINSQALPYNNELQAYVFPAKQCQPEGVQVIPKGTPKAAAVE